MISSRDYRLGPSDTNKDTNSRLKVYRAKAIPHQLPLAGVKIMQLFNHM